MSLFPANRVAALRCLCAVATFLACASLAVASPDLVESFRPGDRVTVNGRELFVERVEANRVVLAVPQPPTASLGAFVTPVEATASGSQDGRPPAHLIDGSGWGETYPGSGVYVHAADLYTGGATMWNGDGSRPDQTLRFDLGQATDLAGMYVWNYNEPNYTARGVTALDVRVSDDGRTWRDAGSYKLRPAGGKEGEGAQAVAFARPQRGRYVEFVVQGTGNANDVAGLAEVRFARAGDAPADAAVSFPAYPPPQHPKLALGQPLEGAENVVFPADAGVLDVTKPPYNAKGDGLADDTAAIQAALDQYPAGGAIVYLPNGVYKISDTLTWPTAPDDSGKLTTLQGQSRAGTILKLVDRAPRFADPRKPRSPIRTGYAPAQRFGNEVRNLTVDTGRDNPGACGLQFMANNQGGVYDVSIVSGDGRGLVGLDLAYTDEQGPMLVRNVSVKGFDVGVATAHALASVTMENVTVEHQNVAGLRNDGQPLSVRKLTSVNRVPAVVNNAGLLVLLESDLRTPDGEGVAGPALRNAGGLLVRDLSTSGYSTALRDAVTDQELVGPKIDLFRSHPPQGLLTADAASLPPMNLPIRETPDVPLDPPGEWKSPLDFGFQLGSNGDAADAIQAAIDSGATTVYLPRGDYRVGKTIHLRGNLRRLTGCKAQLIPAEPLKSMDAPMLRFEDGAAPVVAVDRLFTDFSGGPIVFMEHASQRTLVLRQLMINLTSAAAYRNAPDVACGPLFIEDVVGGRWLFTRQDVWARQFNSERNNYPGTHVTNDGGTLWTLGFKTEAGGTQLETLNGGRTEILGGLIGDTSAGKMAPMFAAADADLSVVIAEVCFNDDPFDKIVRESAGGREQTWRLDESLRGMRLICFEGRAAGSR